MSHFTVLVALPADIARDDLDDAIDAVMAPYSESREVEPYRDYEDGSPEDHWFVSSARRAAEHHRDGTGIKEYDPKFIGWSTDRSSKTPEQQLADLAEEAVWAEKLGSAPTWAQIVDVHNERWPDVDAPLHYDAECDRAYKMSTYNPMSKWDYHKIGGRWRGYFPIARTGHSQVILTNKAWDSPDTPYVDRCDGGRKYALDLAGLRDAKAKEAEADWNTYAATVYGTPDALPWSVFAEKVDRSGNGGYTFDDARDDYGAQERIKRLRESEKFRFWGDAHETFESLTRDEYMGRQADRAVPGYATLDGIGALGWMSPGEMGWFGTSSDDDTTYAMYVKQANEFVDELPDDAWLVLLDCHI